jgi:peptidoglycan hydrolase-like protein with peptidoglycan-binding domain
LRLQGDALLEAQLSPEERAQIQIALIRLGFLNGGADGEFGPLTRDAIRRFQEARGFPQGNFLTREHLAALLAPAPSGSQSPAPMGGPLVPVPPPSAPADTFDGPKGTGRATVVRLEKDGGVYTVPVVINGALALNFVIDSGASDVVIPADVFLTLTRTRTIQGSDIIGERTYVVADGRKVTQKTFRIRSLRVGNRIIENVEGSVGDVAGALLLGQSFLRRFKSWSFDNSTDSLILD